METKYYFIKLPSVTDNLLWNVVQSHNRYRMTIGHRDR